MISIDPWPFRQNKLNFDNLIIVVCFLIGHYHQDYPKNYHNKLIGAGLADIADKNDNMDINPPRQKGRPVGFKPVATKPADQYSTNKSTVKNRKRKLRLDEDHLAVENARKADKTNIAYYIKKLKTTQEWQSASEQERTRLEKAETQNIIDRRYCYSSLYSSLVVLIILQYSQRYK